MKRQALSRLSKITQTAFHACRYSPRSCQLSIVPDASIAAFVGECWHYVGAQISFVKDSDFVAYFAR